MQVSERELCAVGIPADTAANKVDEGKRWSEPDPEALGKHKETEGKREGRGLEYWELQHGEQHLGGRRGKKKGGRENEGRQREKKYFSQP